MIKTANLTGSVSRNAGGLYESVRRLVQSLSKPGMEIRVFGTADEHTAADIGLWSPVKVLAFRTVGPHQFGYSPQFRKLLEDFSPDLVHTHGIWVYSSIATNQYRRRRGVPYLISAHGMLDPWAIRHSHWKKAIAYLFYEGAHLREAKCLRALCESEAIAIRKLGLTNPIAIIPNGIDLPAVPASAALQPSENAGGKRSPELEQLKAAGRKTVLFLSRIHPKKGIPNLLRAWSSTVGSPGKGGVGADWTLAIAGWDQGGHEDELKRLATELGLAWVDARTGAITGAPAVVFLGPQFGAAKAGCYRSCDAFILPSFSEGVPMVVLEAWAYGKPVVITPECNLPAGFTRGAALRIETDVASIGRGLRELFQASPAALQTLGEHGRTLVAEKFAWPVVAQDMKAVYDWLLGGGPKPGCVV